MDAKLTVVLSLITCVLNSIGLAIPYWLATSIYEAGVSSSVNMGLWSVCFHGVIYGLGFDDCIVYEDPNIRTVPIVILQMRYMEIAASVLMLASTIWGFTHTNTNVKPSGVMCTVAGILALVGCTLFATNSDVKTLVTVAGTDYHYHAGFALCIVAGVFSLASGLLYMLANKDMPYTL